ncbi:pickpocket protein 28-like [Eurosta solidaginis]|uniref:pickpocket protein 28-like n=1 Tax=Eurosta solidaginis TaxID=178769 RepID=UPI003530E343
MQDYCENTSIHGLKYIVNKSLYPIERLFFAISFICVVLGTAYFVAKIYEKWNYTPMIVSINPKTSYITDEPFPAVTICNLNQVSKKKVEKLSEFSFKYAIIQMMCKRKVNHAIADAISDWSNMKNLIYETSQSCERMLLECKYGGRIFNCSEIFNSIITDNGLCCTFNIVDPKLLYRSTISKSFLNSVYNHPMDYMPVYWSPDKGYSKDLPEKFIPMKSVGIGESLGLNVILNVERDNYYCSSSDGVGFKILLHNALEVPHMREIGMLLEPGYETKMSIRAERIESDEYVRDIRQSSRKCLFEDERHLRIYNAYTEHNCITECSAGQIYRNCNCIPFFKPMLHDNDSICSFYDTSCVERIRLKTMIIEESSCALKCLGSCNDLKYSSSSFSAPLIIDDFKHKVQIEKNMSDEYWMKNVAIVNIYFKDTTYRSEKNMDFVGATDFLSNIGGIIGLFFGFSFVSLAELIFYVILRPLRMLFISQWTRVVKSAKIQYQEPTIHDYGTLHKNILRNQNILLKGTNWKLAAEKKYMLRNKTKNSNLQWQIGMDYIP